MLHTVKTLHTHVRHESVSDCTGPYVSDVSDGFVTYCEDVTLYMLYTVNYVTYCEDFTYLVLHETVSDCTGRDKKMPKSLAMRGGARVLCGALAPS